MSSSSRTWHLFARAPLFCVASVQCNDTYISRAFIATFLWDLLQHFHANFARRRGRLRLCPVKPERRNLELYDPPISPSFFRANISKRAAYRNPEFYVFQRARAKRVSLSHIYTLSFLRLQVKISSGGNAHIGAVDIGIISRCNNTSIWYR